MKKIVLHPAQQEIYDNDSKYRVCAVGRRFGSFILELKTLYDFANENKHADCLLLVPHHASANYHYTHILENLDPEDYEFKINKDRMIALKNGSRIYVKPECELCCIDSKYGLIIVDSYSEFKNDIFTPLNLEDLKIYQILEEKGKCLVISLPGHAGRKMHMLYLRAEKFDDCSTFKFSSYDNPMNNCEFLDELKSEMSELYYKESIQAEFI